MSLSDILSTIYNRPVERKRVASGDFAASSDTELADDYDHALHLGAFGKMQHRYSDGLIGEVRIYRQVLKTEDLMTLKDELVYKWQVNM